MAFKKRRGLKGKPKAFSRRFALRSLGRMRADINRLRGRLEAVEGRKASVTSRLNSYGDTITSLEKLLANPFAKESNPALNQNRRILEQRIAELGAKLMKEKATIADLTKLKVRVGTRARTIIKHTKK